MACGADIPLTVLALSDGLLRLGVGLAVMAFVVVFVVGVFGQRGRAEMTPEREVALATGQADRRTAFETPALQPVMWLLLLLARAVQARQLKRKLRRVLVAAGSPSFYTPDEYLAVSMLWGLIAAALLETGNLLLAHSVSFALPAVGFVGGTALAIYWLHTQAAKRIREISRRIPYTLDLIALAMGAGATFTEAAATVVAEDRRHPFNVELNTVLAEIELGSTRAQALRNLADRIPLETLRSIVAAVIQAESLGTPLADVLKQQASLLRLQRSVRAEKLAASASVRILVPSMLILMSVVLAVFAPIIIRAIKGRLL